MSTPFWNLEEQVANRTHLEQCLLPIPCIQQLRSTTGIAILHELLEAPPFL